MFVTLLIVTEEVLQNINKQQINVIGPYIGPYIISD